MSQTDPLPSVEADTTASRTNVPSFLNTWMRLLSRSQTNNSPDFDSVRHVVVRNCFAAGVPAAYAGGAVASGGVPYAPQCLLYAPVFESNTTMRRLPVSAT